MSDNVALAIIAIITVVGVIVGIEVDFWVSSQVSRSGQELAGCIPWASCFGSALLGALAVWRFRKKNA
jgi:hypothetical protein